MRKAGPILIAVIGVLALIICFVPGLTLPDASSPTGTRPIETKLGLDLQGGLRVEYQALPVDGVEPTPADMAILKDIIERRVNATGVSEPVVVVQGDDRIVVELPGVTDPDAVRRLVGQTGRLDFVPLGSTQVQVGPGAGSRGLPAAVQWRPGAVRDHRPEPDAGPDRGLRPEGRGRQAVRRLHDQPRGRVLRHRP